MMSGRIASIARSLWTHLDATTIGALGLFLILAWAIFPPPRRADLTEIQGTLSSYSIEADGSWFAQHLARRRSVYVLFKVADNDGRFWNAAVGPGNVRSVFPRLGVAIRFYRFPQSGFSKINGDGEKTYGLTVDGTEITSVDDAVEVDSVLAHYVLPVLGILMLTLARWKWRKADRETQPASSA